jgi:formate dehydrogenase iron-sulfur subunit
VAVGQGPACAKACPTQAIVFGTKDEMLDHAAGRIKDLNSRGFANAGLYNPDGVGGTHVMYVLHHADQPELYSGLAKSPTISPLVEVWKGVSKYFGLFAVAGTIGLGFLHHIVQGPNRPSREDEEKARRLVEGDV